MPQDQDTTASITGAGKVSGGEDPFGTITYTKPGKYTYTITETGTPENGWTYNTDGAVTATVTISADANGALSARVVYSKGGDAAEITNKYETGGIKVVKTAQLNGTKDPGAEGQTFRVALFSDSTGTTQVGEPQTITIGENGTGETTFEGLTVGTTYYVFEMDGTSKAGTKIGDYTVVTGSGSAEATVAISNTVNLVNNKKTGDLKVSKTLSGNATDPNKVFHFEVTVAGVSGNYEAEGAATSATFTDGKATVELKGGQSITIKGLPDGAAYSVTETEANTEGYTTSSSGASGNIDATKTADATPTAAFTNTKNKGGLTITKTFAGNTNKLSADDKAKISFTVSGPEWDDPQTVNYADMENGVKTFTGIELGEYTVAENVAEGKTYTTTYKVGSTGTETAGTSATVDVGASGTTVAFTNTYQETELTLDAEKVINAKAGTTVPSKTFNFSMSAGEVKEAGETSVPMPQDQDTTASITGAGKVSTGTDKFGTITYTKPGKYTYTITETGTAGTGWTYNTDGDVTATVTVSANENGALSASVVYSKGSDAAEITNKYDASGTATIEIQKLLSTGANPVAGRYEFQLKKGGDVVDETSNDATGKVKFKTLTYGLEDAGQTYTYVIHESNTAAPGWTNAEDMTVTVAVGADTGTGTLATTVTYPNNKAEMTNTYDANGSIELTGTKKFEHGDFAKETFTFSVYKKSDFEAASSKLLGLKKVDRNELATDEGLQAKKVASATTAGLTPDKNGNVSFEFTPDIKFVLSTLDPKDKKEDGSYSYDYVVVEDIPESAVKKTVGDETFYYDSKKDIKYDATVYEVTLTVKDNGDGTLDVKATNNKTKFGFENAKVYTKLSLTKSIDKFIGEDTEGELVNATIVFSIKYTDPITGTQADRSESFVFKKDKVGPLTKTIKDVPIDADITIKEVYSSNYSPGKVTLTKSTDKDGYPVWEASCDNTQVRTTTGSGIINNVKKDGDKYVWEADNGQGDQPVPEPPDSPK